MSGMIAAIRWAMRRICSACPGGICRRTGSGSFPKLPVKPAHFSGIGNFEAHPGTGLGGAGSRFCDGGRGTVQSRHRVALAREVDRVVAQAATGVEDFFTDRTERLEFHQPRLRLSDVPRDSVRSRGSGESGLPAVKELVRFGVVPEWS